MPGMTPGTASGAIGISVILPTGGRMDLLDRCLDTLTRQTLPGTSYEIIVVDDEPNHNTLHLVAGWRTRTLDRGPRLVYLANANRHGPAAARNLGWRSAQGAILAFTDEDAVPASSWLAQGLAAFGDDVDVLCGRLDLRLPARLTEAGHAVGEAQDAAFCTTNCFCRKSLLERLEGFDERFEQAAHCDADLHFRLLALGAHIARAPDALVVLPMQPAPWGASLVRTHAAVFDALLYKKHPRLYREHIAAAPPWDYYLAVGALLAALGLLAAGSGPGTLLAGLGWLALTARLCRQRLRGTVRSVSYILDVVVTSVLIPPLAVFWRLAGAIRYRVRFS
ncbi:glycosyltransferase family 2 protein [Massilia sp. CMS3.1]|uniref:glycosyltransferase family 2 protein n=1 Tax=Massilia sp. CMS3.1 TaxID=3373083 RepID=UPI003EE670EB